MGSGSSKYEALQKCWNCCFDKHFCLPGDFHFLWECLRVLLQLFWGTPKQTGSLCHLRELVHRVQVDKSGKVFNTCDEFVLHAFKGHLVAAICTYLNIHSKVSPIKHDSSLQWLEQTALAVTKEVLYPPSCHSDDGIYSLHRSFLHMAFLYYDLRTAIRFEDGEHITVKPLLADTPNSGHLLYSGQCAMYQVLFPFIPYLRNLRIAATS